MLKKIILPSFVFAVLFVGCLEKAPGDELNPVSTGVFRVSKADQFLTRENPVYKGTVQKMVDTFEMTGDIIRKNGESKAEEEKHQETPINSNKETTFVGKWRVYADGTWRFGNSKGTWIVSGITEDDWNRWGISSYGPKRKITLKGWNNAIADGPVEEGDGRVDFIWIIYHVKPPQVQNAGTVWLKFGQI